MMLVDCNTCPVRHVRCADCMVTALTALPLAPRPVLAEAGAAPTPAPAPADGGSEAGLAGPPRLALDRAERHAVSVLLGAGLVTVQEANAARAVPTEGSASASLHSHHAPARSARATRAAG
ncbi:MAG TPA: hypothetical protein VFL38_15090 [Humibacillus xanthopallidus]|nr:hypothetical protein [Humibacillus xanthopallidus]